MQHRNIIQAIRRFPKSLFAGMFGFDKHVYFEAAEGTEAAPEVKFWTKKSELLKEREAIE